MSAYMRTSIFLYAVLYGVMTASQDLRAAPASDQQAVFAGDRQPDGAVTAAERTEVIGRVLAMLRDKYVFPDAAGQMVKALRINQQERRYDNITSAQALASALTADLQAVSHDKHLVVSYSHETLPAMPSARWADPTPEERDRITQRLRGDNFGFRKVELMEGNIGYLSLVEFAPAQSGWDTAVAAMRFLADSDALIIDLRDNQGGSPEMVALLCSYLFDNQFKPVHLSDAYSRVDGGIHQLWTLPYVPGKRYTEKAVYVLTSKRTFSSAEGFAYDLKALQRATIVGETTAGGAHIGSWERIGDHFTLFVPSGRFINPITKTNWEGVGVAPDRAVASELALKTAHLMALRKLLETASDISVKQQLQNVIDAIVPDVNRLQKASFP